MKLLQVLIILLFVVLADGAQPKKCFNNIAGYCRKKCKLVEISEMGCPNGKYCCVNETKNRKYKNHTAVEKPVEFRDELKPQDYIILPTITYYTISI
ncbi:beta-defensin 128 [Arvicanthis niloticus]|uniref:beta-defensin 128 n=1 Tax=Arvicanthis niloticus TaxID=61156 RepID=UPI00148689FE|nr:beta-defensin 128 [Arvicanthis niloticus]